MKLSDLNQDDIVSVQNPNKSLKLSDLKDDDIVGVENPKAISQSQSAATGALASTGVVDEASGLAEGAGRIIGLRGLGSNNFSDIHTDPSLLEGGFIPKLGNFLPGYREGRDVKRDQQDEAHRQNPYSYDAGEIGGALATGFVPGLNISAEANLATRLGKAATLGGAYGLANSRADLTKGDVVGAGEDTLKGAGYGGLFQGAGEIAVPVVKYGFNKAKEGLESFAPKLGRVAADIPEDVTRKYLADPQRFQTSKTTEQLKDDLDVLIGQKRAGVQGIEDKLNAAKSEYENALSSKQNELADSSASASDNIGDLKSGLSDAKSNYRDAVTNLKYDLRNEGDPKEAVDTISGAIQQLKSDVISGSNDALSELKSNGDKPVFPTLWLRNAYKEGIDSLKFEGGAPITQDERAVYEKLKSEYQGLKRLPQSIPLSSVKKLIQGLDKSIDYTSSFGSFNPIENRARQAVRSKLNEVLGNASPGYKQKMLGVAEKSKLLSSLNDRFGTPEQIIGRVKNLSKPESFTDQDLLSRLGEHTGVDINATVAPKIQASQTASNPRLFSQASEGLPEYETLNSAQKALDEAPLPLNSTQRRQAALGEIDSQFAKPIEDLGLSLDDAKQKLKDLGMSERRSEAVVKSFERGNPRIEDRRAIEELSPQLLHDLETARVSGAFNRTAAQGSRRTLVGKAVGGALGALGGKLIGGPLGAGAGAVAGFTSDKYAGQIFKGLLDGSVNLQQFFSNPSSKGILGKFYNVLQQAASRGNKSFAATHYVLQQSNPEYRKLINQDSPNDK